MMAQALAEPTSGPFRIKDCALIAIATGRRAFTLRELREGLADIHGDSVYYHFWGNLLEPRFEEREYNNDFAGWVRHGLHDGVLAERLAVLDPTDFAELDALREELVDTVEERLEESEYLPWVRASRPFEFTRSQIVVFDTGKRAAHAEELARLVPSFSTGSIFYHFIDARRRVGGGHDDFSAWLASLEEDHAELRARLAAIDPYFGSLTELRGNLTAAFQAHFAGAG
ncbi:MAG: hypothetical protein GWN84_11835 [Gammaproteobacteria bacterium]|nr:hypothetical protein [Gammaproteobacteria bacterium]NIR83558.1 hypothetical protein [Gammaproteobacteria bacterium]NIR91480.1 hypothetical protein [Gammaproteobacteria bacterium]NIU04720.1 hypothetical protein [Gammaproteobacteria bacterium]NIV51762.1 hypothetical protein [Gammaproteobacteria bacterium]